MKSRKAQVQPHLQPERVPSLSDDTSEFGQASGIHFNPLMEVIPSCTPRPIIKIIFINTCLERKRDVLQKDLESSFFYEPEKKRGGVEDNEEGDKKITVPSSPYSKS